MRSISNVCLATLLALTAVGAYAQTAVPSPVPAPYVVTEARAVQAAESLFQDVQALGAKVTPCVNGSDGSPAACVCKFPAELKRVQDQLRSVRGAYPEWEKQVVNWTEPASKQSRAISVQALIRQSYPVCPAK
jgi:hypothetical protein